MNKWIIYIICFLTGILLVRITSDGFSIEETDYKCSDKIFKSKSGGCSWNNCITCKDPSHYCAQSNENCTQWGLLSDKAQWCPFSPSPAPAPAPTPAPAPGPKPSGSVIQYWKTNKPFVKAVFVDEGAQFGYNIFSSLFTNIAAAGFNVIILSFYLSESPFDWTLTWEKLTPEERTQLKSQLAQNNILLLASWGGLTAPGVGPSRCDFSWVIRKLSESNMSELQYDGIDLDFESVGRMTIENCGNFKEIYDKVKSQYGSNPFIFTSAPQTPYFVPNSWSFDYIAIEQTYPNMFDWYNIQFYNNGETDMEITNKILSDIIQNGIPTHKIVVGKCNQGCDSSYFVKGKELINKLEHEVRGVILWEWDNTNPATSASKWLEGVTPAPPAPPAPTPTPAPPSTNKAGHTSSSDWNKFILPKTEVTSPEIKYLMNEFVNKNIKNTKSLVNIMMTKQTKRQRDDVNNIYPDEDTFILDTLWTSLEKINRENIFDDKFITNIEGDKRYGLINLIAFLSESGVETGYFTACDEEWFKTGGDYSKNPSCGQWAPSGVGGYMGQNYTGGSHDCKKDTSLNLEAVTWNPWAKKDLGLLKCKPDSGSTGPDGSGTEGCCFWGRGSIQLTGQKNIGDFNNAIQQKHPQVDVCKNPNLLCLDPEFRWLGGLHYWITVVQKDPNFIPQIKKYVSEGFVTDPNKLNIPLDKRCPQANPSTAGCSDPTKNSNSFPAGCSAMVNMGNWNANSQDGDKRLKDFCALVEYFFK